RVCPSRRRPRRLPLPSARQARRARHRRSRRAAPPWRRRPTPRAPPAHAAATPPPTRARPGRAIRSPSSRRFLLRSWTDRLERSQAERTRLEGPPSSSTSYGTTSFADGDDAAEESRAPHHGPHALEALRSGGFCEIDLVITLSSGEVVAIWLVW